MADAAAIAAVRAAEKAFLDSVSSANELSLVLNHLKSTDGSGPVRLAALHSGRRAFTTCIGRGDLKKEARQDDPATTTSPPAKRAKAASSPPAPAAAALLSYRQWLFTKFEAYMRLALRLLSQHHTTASLAVPALRTVVEFVSLERDIYGARSLTGKSKILQALVRCLVALPSLPEPLLATLQEELMDRRAELRYFTLAAVE